MSKSKKPRKAYKPKQYDPASIMNRVLMRAQVLASTDALNQTQQQQLKIRNWASFDAIVNGSGNESHANDLVNAVNVSMVMAEAGLGREEIPAIRAAQKAVLEMGERHGRTGRYGFDGQGLQAMKLLLSVHDAQLESEDCTEGFLVRCIEEVKARIQRGQIERLEEFA